MKQPFKPVDPQVRRNEKEAEKNKNKKQSSTIEYIKRVTTDQPNRSSKAWSEFSEARIG